MEIKYIVLVVLNFYLKGITTQNATTGSVTVVGTADEEVDNDVYIKNWDESSYNTACEWMSLNDSEKFKLNLSRPMNYEDVVKLTFLNKGRKLHETILKFPDDINWKRKLVNSIWSIFQTSCPNAFVKFDYMNIMRELVVIYLNSVEPRVTPDHQDVWSSLQLSLDNCTKNKLPPYNFTSNGLKIQSLILTEDQLEGLDDNNDDTNAIIEEKSSDEKKDVKDKYVLDLEPQVEKADTVYNLDVIIDTLWLVFSHAWARCFRTAPSNEIWALRFKRVFFEDILEPLEERWANAGEDMILYMNYIMGDYDVSLMQYNIPFCTEAAYANPRGSLLESQLVRPLKVADVERGVKKFQNMRLN